MWAKRSLRGIGVMAAAVIMLGIGAGVVSADETAKGGSRADGMLRKLGRGITNIVTCPGELIRTPELVGRKDGYLAAWSVGLLQGAWRTVLRGVTGVFEVVTFLVEIPEDYGPLMKPEFVFAHGEWTPE